MSPPSGQYANTDSIDKYSIFYTNIIQNPNDTLANFQKVTNYQNEFGENEQIYDEVAGIFVSPQQLSAQAFAQKFKLSWAEGLLPYHPEFLKLNYYEKLSSSHEWDLRFGSSETYAEALAKGYLNPTNNTGTPFNKFSATGQNDPDPLSTFSDSTYKTALEAALTNYTGGQLNSSVATSMWAFATGVIKCADETEGCLTNYATLDSAFNASICTADLDMAWRAFRGFYLETKRNLISAHIKALYPTPSATTLFNDHRQPHFSDASELLLATGTQLPTNKTAAKQQMEASINEFYSSNCNAYVAQWWFQLKPCNFTSADSSVIIPRLIQVCKEGSDATHSYGSSSVKPSSVFTYKSFEEVLKWYSDSTGRPYNSTCNAYLITAPQSYGNHPAVSEVKLWMKPDSCQCTQISALYTKYESSNKGDVNFSAYLFRTTGSEISNSALDSLRNMCDGAITCKSLTSPISLPPILQCGVKNACLECVDVRNAYNKFKIQFPGAVPQLGIDDPAQLSTNLLFASYLNYRFGINKTAGEYLEFISKCDSALGNSPSPNADSLGALVRDFQEYYSALAKGQVFKNYRITRGAIEQVNAANAIVKAMHHQGELPANYTYADYTRNFTAKLGSVMLDPVGNYQAIAPLPLGYTFPGDSRLEALWNNTILETDFAAGYASLEQLSTKFYATPVKNLGKSFLQIWNSRTYNPFPGVATPTLKYLPVDIGVSVNDIYEFAFFEIPSHVQSASSFTQFYSSSVYNQTTGYSNYVFNNSDIREIKNLRIATEFLDTNAGCITLSSKALKVTLSLTNGEEKDAYLYNNYDCSGYIKYLEVIDSNLYNADCNVAFTNYFNQKRNTTFSFAELDSLYQTDYGQQLQPCSSTTMLTICGKSEPIFPSVSINEVDNCTDNEFFAVSKGTELHRAYTDSLISEFESRYRAKCMQAYKYESFTVTSDVSEYHHTLYYFDQAGNLVRTVPPEGVHPNYDVVWLQSVKEAHDAGISIVPNHTLSTQYRYNTLNQVVAQYTPDAEGSKFWYDRLGRLVLSRNAKQRTISALENGKQYSYTLYDHLGRITEVGQIVNATTTPVTDVISRSQVLLQSWLTNSAANKEQITQTVYDLPYPGFSGIGGAPLLQRNLRNRVSYTSFSKGGNAVQYNQASFYTYDIHGNVDTLVQDYGSSSFAAVKNVMNENGNRFKKLVYRYDLISGKVNSVAYQPNQADQFYHKYGYDAENKLLNVETSHDSVHWEKDAHYQYYKHGPLARTVLGQQQVQGVDYAYTLQGWLKGVNSTSLNAGFDIGEDGKLNSQGQFIALDVYSFGLNYFTGDYSSISGANPFPGSSGYLAGSYKPLYNGNISSMAVNIGKLNDPLLYSYTYDQLNRITAMDAFRGLNQVNNEWNSLAAINDYKERISYDANGNILKYLRHGHGSKLSMDSLNYNYNRDSFGILQNNRLSYVRDSVSSQEYAEDLDIQTAGNFTYDLIGNLVKDNASGIDSIEWTVYGKINKIIKTNGTTITYNYDAGGNRISKGVQSSGGNTNYTWYVRDASGNVMATYQSSGTGSDLASYPLSLNEHHLYGSSRIGIVSRKVDVKTTFVPASILNFSRGEKQYELSNHLGNVLTTITDKKFGVASAENSSLIDFYTADVRSAQDYYPFGMLMPGRHGYAQGAGWVNEGGGNALPQTVSYDSRNGKVPLEYKATQSIEFIPGFVSELGDEFTAFITSEGSNESGSGMEGVAGAYRYGFNGKENDNEVKGEGSQQDYGMRIHDPRLGRFLSVDPLQEDYPELTPYQFASNTPVWAIDIDGLESGIPGGASVAAPLINKGLKKADEWLSSPTSSTNNRIIAEQYNAFYGTHLSADDIKGQSNWEFLKRQTVFSIGQYSKNTPGKLRIPSAAHVLEVGPQTPKTIVKSNTGNVITAPETVESITATTNKQTTAATLKVGTYSDMRKVNIGTGLSADHIPSFAAIKQIREQALGRTLTASEAAVLKNNTLTLSIETKLHQSTSQTYGGRNTIAKIAADAANPLKAIRDNVNAYRPALIKEGYTNSEIDHTITTLSAPYKKN
ncbi:MAG TPA: RHS repeat-associated core domain-containing protein [Chitinophagaceae bacterium]|nr:RHS repeat-associated core domain-containing protein [Chitinophagaceae bacterium]